MLGYDYRRFYMEIGYCKRKDCKETVEEMWFDHFNVFIVTLPRVSQPWFQILAGRCVATDYEE